MPWVYDPQSGGTKIPERMHIELCKQAESFSAARSWYPQIKLKLRFKSQFCYVDTVKEGDERIFPLCRLRYLNSNQWSMAFFTWSNERYEPCIFSNGKWEGTLEAALIQFESFIF